MEILTGLLMSAIIARNFVTLNVVDDSGKKQSIKLSKGKYRRQDWKPYINKKIDVAFEWGKEGERKLLDISFPTPTINLDIFKTTK